MPRGRPRTPTHLLLVRGTFRRDRHGKRPDAPRPPDAGALTEGQRELLSSIPRHLSPEARAIFAEQAQLAWWLTAADGLALAAFARASEQHTAASRELDRLMRAPNFSNPSSPEWKGGRVWLAIADKAADRLMLIADKLGFSPISRQRLGIDADARPRPKRDDDPWAKLRLVHKPPDPPA
jgi:phage terminase small subunit